MSALTKRQDEVLKLFMSFLVCHQRQPTVRELQQDLGVSSPYTITCHLESIVKKGYLLKVGHHYKVVGWKLTWRKQDG